jgi:uncharacterized protein
MTRQELTYQVKETVKRFDPAARVILFGSRARGNFEKNSDWDFLILTSLDVDEYLKRKIRSELIETELNAEEVISTLIFSESLWEDYHLTPLYENISKEGIEI